MVRARSSVSLGASNMYRAGRWTPSEGRMADMDALEGYDDKTRAQVEAMIEAERRALAHRGHARMLPNRTKRGVLLAAGSSLAAGMASFLMPARAADRAASDRAPPGAVWREAPQDPTKVPGTPIGEDGGYGSRSEFETEVRWRFPTATTISSWSMTPLDRSEGIVTPSGLHFERHHGGIPTIDPARHSLVVHGMVERPIKFSMADLKRFPSVTRKHFIECSGNGLTEWNKPTLKTVQGTHGLLSTSE